VRSSSTIPTTPHTTQGHNGSKAGSQDGAARRTALDVTKRHQGQSLPTRGRSGSPSWNCLWRWGVHGHSPRTSIPRTRSPWHEGRPQRARHDARTALGTTACRGVIPGSTGKRSARRPSVRRTRRCGLR
jgi:hypothetical protein